MQCIPDFQNQTQRDQERREQIGRIEWRRWEKGVTVRGDAR